MKNQAGYSLMEMLVAVTIIALLGSVVAIGFRTHIGATRIGGWKVAAENQSSTVMERIERDVRNGLTCGIFPFVGEPQEMELVTNNIAVSDHPSPWQLSRVRFQLSAVDSSCLYQIRYFPRHLREDTTILLSNVQSLSFQYATRNEVSGVEWHDTFLGDDNRPLPLAIEISIKIRVGPPESGRVHKIKRVVVPQVGQRNCNDA